MKAAVLFIVLAWTATASAAPLDDEMTRRNDELVKQGFNLTQRFRVTTAAARLEFLVPPTDGGEQTVTLWFESERGTIAVRMLGPKDDIVMSWKARSGEQRLVRALDPGKYVIEVGGAEGRGVVGVKGPIVARCPDSARVSEHAADPAKGFRWPYLLLSPTTNKPTTLLVVPNNTGFLSEDLELLRASASCELARQQAMADRLGVPVLVPMFPRTATVYTHALSRDAMVTKTQSLARLDLQLIAMIDDARAVLGSTLQSRVLMAGFSASGSFTNRFAMLHPERVLAAAIGSPGGWPIAPSTEWGYPVGISDVRALTGASVNLTALRKVPLFLFLGDQDVNDAVPYRDSFSKADEALIMKRFGKTPVARWDTAKRLYSQAKLRATFTLYPGTAHEVSPAMSKDIEAVFAAALAN